MTELILIDGADPYEYFCTQCGQLRFAFEEPKKCGSCDCEQLITGKPNTLNIQFLRREWIKIEKIQNGHEKGWHQGKSKFVCSEWCYMCRFKVRRS